MSGHRESRQSEPAGVPPRGVRNLAALRPRLSKSATRACRKTLDAEERVMEN
jgi:hypothetical protein